MRSCRAHELILLSCCMSFAVTGAAAAVLMNGVIGGVGSLPMNAVIGTILYIAVDGALFSSLHDRQKVRSLLIAHLNSETVALKV